MKPTVGRIVYCFNDGGLIGPAIVSKVWSETR